MPKRKEPEDYHVLARKRGFEWLGPVVFRNSVKTWWQCPEKHEWETCYSHIQTGTGCPICAVERWAEKRRKKPADYYALAVGRGFKWLGPEVLNTHQRTQWGCASGHKWETAYSNIQQGQGCPYCNGNVRKLPCDYHAMAASRGFKWLGPSMRTVDQKTFWECAFGHKWETRYSVIRNGYGCPICAHKKAAERYRHKPATYHSLADKRGFKWLGPEVGGVHIRTWWECSKEHKWKAGYANIQRGKGCPFCAGVVKKTAADYYVLAEMRGFIWQGQGCPKNIHSKTFWGCPERHEWEATYHDIQQGNGCPHCAGTFPKTAEDYHEVGKDRNIEWIGEELPKDTTTKTPWKCSGGHEWEAIYSNIQRGTGCPHCVGLARKVSADYQALAKERGFEWIGKEPPKNVSMKTSWKCSRGHVWETRYSNIQQGAGCHYCLDLVNGAQVSKAQRQIHKMMRGILNYRHKPYWIDVAFPDEKIGIEYDSWWEHGYKLDKDAKRAAKLLAWGWKMLYIKSNHKVPSQRELDEALTELRNGEKTIKIVLDDWGKGDTRADVRARGKVDPWDGSTTVREGQQLGLW